MSTLPPEPTSDSYPIVRPGDLLYFAGQSPLSQLIRWVTWSRFSHVAIVSGHQGQVWESTTLSRLPCTIQRRSVSGVQCHYLYQVIDDARATGVGVWVQRLRPRWSLPDWSVAKLSAFLRDHLGVRYDYREAGLSGTRLLKYLHSGTATELFCSELVASALSAVQRFPLTDPARLNPGALARECERIRVFGPPEQIVEART